LWIERRFEVDERGIALLFGVGGLANAVMGMLAGRLSDRIGRKGLVIFASAGMGLAMMATPFMPSYAAILVLFLLTMAMVGIRISPFNAWVTGLVSPARRGSLMAMFLATGQVGFAIGSAIAGPVFGSVGFVGCASIGMTGALVTAGLLSRVPEPR
jgi:MFS family permease